MAASVSPTFTYHTTRYTCAGNKKVSVSYAQYGDNGPQFIILQYAGQKHGLALAMSGSGARYTNQLNSSLTDYGLEWWVKGNIGTLSAFSKLGSADTKPILNQCVRR